MPFVNAVNAVNAVGLHSHQLHSHQLQTLAKTLLKTLAEVASWSASEAQSRPSGFRLPGFSSSLPLLSGNSLKSTRLRRPKTCP